MMRTAADWLVPRIEREEPGAWKSARIENSPSGHGHKHVLIRSHQTGGDKRLTCAYDWDQRDDPERLR